MSIKVRYTSKTNPSLVEMTHSIHNMSGFVTAINEVETYVN